MLKTVLRIALVGSALLASGLADPAGAAVAGAGAGVAASSSTSTTTVSRTTRAAGGGAARATTSSVIELDESNFEHETQAGTGATTGDWFVKFYAPWCGHCMRLAPAWDELASLLKGRVNVAKVDASKYRSLGERFKVKGFPTLILFSKGKMYEFEGERSVEKLKAFATGGFKKAAAAAVPAPPSWMDAAKGMAATVGGDLAHMLLNEKAAAAVVALIGFLTGVVCSKFCCCKRVCGRAARGAVAEPEEGAAVSSGSGTAGSAGSGRRNKAKKDL